MAAHLKYTNEILLELIRAKQQELGRTPRMTDFPSGLRNTMKMRFKNWDDILSQANGSVGHWHRWTREELIKIAQDFFSRTARFPRADEVATQDGRTIWPIIKREFGNTNAWLEESIHTSPRVEILRALMTLTQNGCDRATPVEMRYMISKRIEIPLNAVSLNTRELADDGFVTGGGYDRTHWWKMTEAGRDFLKRFL